MRAIFALLLVAALSGCSRDEVTPERGEHQWDVINHGTWNVGFGYNDGQSRTSRMTIPGGYLYREEVTTDHHGVNVSIVFVPTVEVGRILLTTGPNCDPGIAYVGSGNALILGGPGR